MSSDTKIIVPMKTGEKLKFPLHKPVLLFMLSGKIYSCRIKYAGKDFIKITDVHERIIENNQVKFIDLQLPEDAVFSRSKIEGYTPKAKRSNKSKNPTLISIQDKRKSS